jgi:hypothetical protein
VIRLIVRGTGWITATIFVLLLILWLASGWYWIFLSDTRFARTYAFNGRIDLSWQQNYVQATALAYGELSNGQFPGWQRGGGWNVSFANGLPTLSGPIVDLLVATLVIAAAGLFWPLRRRRHGHCKACDYNLTGNESGRCPECGSPVLA